MEGFFCPALQFFCQKCEQGRRQSYDLPHNPHTIGKEVADFQRPAAHNYEIQPRACQDGQYIVPPHRTVSCPEGVAEERGSDQQPKGQIQRAPQKRQAQPGTEDTEKIVYHPHQGPHCQRADQGDRLPRN